MQMQYLSSIRELGGSETDITLSSYSSTTEQAPANSYEYPATYIREGVSAFAGIVLLTGLLLMLRRVALQQKEAQGANKGNLEANRTPIPCQSCHYFNPNTFMPCAVNPSLALRKEAIDCSDYCPRKTDSVTRTVHN